MNQRHILVCGIIFADKDILKFFKIHFFTVADIFERESPKKKKRPSLPFSRALLTNLPFSRTSQVFW